MGTTSSLHVDPRGHNRFQLVRAGLTSHKTGDHTWYEEVGEGARHGTHALREAPGAPTAKAPADRWAHPIGILRARGGDTIINDRLAATVP